jgi:acyl carrier protein
LSISQEQISSDARFKEELGVDSLDMVELIMEIENQFKISIPDEAVEEITTVGQAENYIRMKVVTTEQIL